MFCRFMADRITLARSKLFPEACRSWLRHPVVRSDHIRRGTLNLSEIKAVVLDEADEMLDMGFAEDLEAIFAALPEKRQTALFSATLPPKIAKIAENHLHDAFHILIPKEKVPEEEQPKVKQSAYIVGRNHKTAALGRILDIESPRLAIVFARTRNEVDELAESLRGRGYSVEPLHGRLRPGTA